MGFILKFILFIAALVGAGGGTAWLFKKVPGLTQKEDTMFMSCMGLVFMFVTVPLSSLILLLFGGRESAVLYFGVCELVGIVLLVIGLLTYLQEESKKSPPGKKTPEEIQMHMERMERLRERLGE